MAAFEGNVTFDFGAVPGTNLVTTTVADANVTSASRIEIFLMGNDSTATHNAYEHAILELGGFQATPISIINVTSFVAQASTLLRLTGTIKCRYVIST
jgi:hypothetical protein